MKNKNIFIILLILCTVLLATAVSAKNCGDGVDTCACGDTITANYNLSFDLDCSGTGADALTIGGNDITFDCAGHFIKGNTADDIFESAGVQRVMIKNCNMSNANYGWREASNNYDSTMWNNTINVSGYAVWYKLSRFNFSNNNVTNGQVRINGGQLFDNILNDTGDCISSAVPYMNFSNNIFYCGNLAIEGSSGSYMRIINNSFFNGVSIIYVRGDYNLLENNTLKYAQDIYSPPGHFSENNTYVGNIFNETDFSFYGYSYLNVTQNWNNSERGNFWIGGNGNYEDSTNCTDGDSDGYCDNPLNVTLYAGATGRRSIQMDYFPLVLGYIAGGAGDTTAPIVTLSSPEDNYTTTINSITFSVNVSDNIYVQNISLWHNNTGTWHLNDTISPGAGNDTHQYDFTVDNMQIINYSIWNVYACDNSSNCAWSDYNRTFNITIAPTDANVTNANLTANSCTTSSNFQLFGSYSCVGQQNCSVSMDFAANNSALCTYVSGNNTFSGITLENGTSTTFNVTYVCISSATHNFHYNITNLGDAMQTIYGNATCSAAASGGGLSANEANCLMYGYFSDNSTACAIGDVRGEMNMIGIIIALIASALFFWYVGFSNEGIGIKLFGYGVCLITILNMTALVYLNELGDSMTTLLKINFWSLLIVSFGMGMIGLSNLTIRFMSINEEPKEEIKWKGR